MSALFSAEGRAALATLFQAPAILGFDFDGTLAPIRPTPGEVEMDSHIAALFSELTRSIPVAVVSGRSVIDVRARLPGTPRWIVGNHGAEGLPGAGPAQQEAHRAICADWCAQLQGLLAHCGEGVVLEDKRFSLSLHFRQAHEPDAARARLLAGLAALHPPPQVVPGKCVLNLIPHGAIDKFAAMQALARLHGPGTGAFFAGDDDNDETVFRQAPPHWVTVKVGCEGASAARFRVPCQEAMQDCLALLLAHGSSVACR
jgi:trehalose 6-phosphate phosphatase